MCAVLRHCSHCDVCSGFVWFDCVDVGVTGEGTIMDACPIASGGWEVCAPVTTVNYTVKFR